MLEISAQDARRVLLLEQGLLDDPGRKATPAAVLKIVRQLGFVQLDSIPVVARAHDLTLRARLDGYRPAMLKRLHEKRRALFEHWTHDASVIPIEYYPHWRHRSRRFLSGAWVKRWIEHRIGESELDRVLAETRQRIADRGPLRSRDFAAPDRKAKGKGGWWDWKPHKAALEYLWWAGDLTITARHRFEKVYDLPERVFPEAHAAKTPEHAETIDMACREALTRLGCGTPAEIAAFFDLVSLSDARRWCAAAVGDGKIQEVWTESGKAFAVKNFNSRRRAAEKKLEATGETLRLLAPFDPVIRDRKRTLRLFDFDYRFEAFVPAPKRVYGYYVMPILQGDVIIGRCDLKTNPQRGVIEIKGLWWEDGKKANRRRMTLFEEALGKLEACVLAGHEAG